MTTPQVTFRGHRGQPKVSSSSHSKNTEDSANTAPQVILWRTKMDSPKAAPQVTLRRAKMDSPKATPSHIQGEQWKVQTQFPRSHSRDTEDKRKAASQVTFNRYRGPPKDSSSSHFQGTQTTV